MFSFEFFYTMVIIYLVSLQYLNNKNIFLINDRFYSSVSSLWFRVKINAYNFKLTYKHAHIIFNVLLEYILYLKVLLFIIYWKDNLCLFSS